MNSRDSANIEIRQVTGKKALNIFIRVPWSIYENDPNWIPPLLMERKAAFSSKQPYFKHATWRAWIAYRNGKPIGRISAQIDELHQQRYNNKTGFFVKVKDPEDIARNPKSSTGQYLKPLLAPIR